MTFAEIPVNSLFRYKGEVMLKKGPVTFISTDSPSLGERMIEPNMDKYIEAIEATAVQTAKEISRVTAAEGTAVIHVG